MDVAAGSPASDALLVARCRAGDQDAWEELVERFSRYVYAVAIRGFRLSHADAEDVFQDVFSRVYGRLGSLRDDAAVRPWIAQLTRRACIDHLRSRAREDVGTEPVEEAADEATLARLDEALAVRQALDGLPDHCRDVLDRFFCRDQSYADIGGALGIPPGTIASRISRCLARLRRALEGKTAPGSPVPSA